MVVCLEQGADLHMAQLMPLPLTVCCFSKIQIGFTFTEPAHLGSPGKRAVKLVWVCAITANGRSTIYFDADDFIFSWVEIEIIFRYAVKVRRKRKLHLDGRDGRPGAATATCESIVDRADVRIACESVEY